MKKLIAILAMCVVSSAFAFDGTNTTTQNSASNATNGPSTSTITFSPVTTNVASDLKDQGATAAKIQADAAIEIAKLQANTGTRDASADRNAALDRNRSDQR